MTVTPPLTARWQHTFEAVFHPYFFAHRDPSVWLDDILESAELPGAAVTRFYSTLHHDPPREQLVLKLRVVGPERVLRFVCVLLNQHAEQAPDDPTPPREAERLEATLAGPANARPGCPACGEARWKIDGDVAARAAIVFGDDDDMVVHIDRCGPDGSRLVRVSSIECQACGHTVPDDGGAAIYNGLAFDGPATTWRILVDYREF